MSLININNVRQLIINKNIIINKIILSRLKAARRLKRERQERVRHGRGKTKAIRTYEVLAWPSKTRYRVEEVRLTEKRRSVDEGRDCALLKTKLFSDKQ